MTMPEFELLKATHDKVEALSVAFAAHEAEHKILKEVASANRGMRLTWLAIAAAWAGAIAALVNVFVRH